MPLRNAIFSLSLFLAACGTPYQQKGLMGGFTEARFDETTYQIAFKGNAYISADTVQRYVIYRAAELTSEAGFDYFVVTDAQDISRVWANTTPATATTQTNLYGTTGINAHAHQLGDTTAVSGSGTTDLSGTSTTTYRPAKTTFMIKAGESVMIKMGKGPKPEIANSYQAAAVLQYLGPSIKRP